MRSVPCMRRRSRLRACKHFGALLRACVRSQHCVCQQLLPFSHHTVPWLPGPTAPLSPLSCTRRTQSRRTGTRTPAPTADASSRAVTPLGLRTAALTTTRRRFFSYLACRPSTCAPQPAGRLPCRPRARAVRPARWCWTWTRRWCTARWTQAPGWPPPGPTTLPSLSSSRTHSTRSMSASAPGCR
jgi:hypothetical protein